MKRIIRRFNHSNLHDIYFSILQSEPSYLEKYLKHGGSIGLKGPDGKSLLIGCIEEDKNDLFCRCIELGISIMVKDDRGLTPLHWAAMVGKEDFLKVLLQHGASVNSRDKDGNSPLLLAVINKNTNVAKILVKREGCGLDIQNEDGKSALHVALETHDTEMVQHLLESGASTSLRDTRHSSPLLVALKQKNLNTAEEILLFSSSEGNLFSSDLLWVCRKPFFDAIHLLLSYGVDPCSPASTDMAVELPVSASFNSKKAKSIGIPAKEIISSPLMGRAQKMLIREYGYATTTGPQNKLLQILLSRHKIQKQEGVLDFYNHLVTCGLQLDGMSALISCCNSCRCRDILNVSRKHFPVSLKLQCRTAVRCSLGIGVSRKVGRLPVPLLLKKFLCFTDELTGLC